MHRVDVIARYILTLSPVHVPTYVKTDAYPRAARVSSRTVYRRTVAPTAPTAPTRPDVMTLDTMLRWTPRSPLWPTWATWTPGYVTRQRWAVRATVDAIVRDGIRREELLDGLMGRAARARATHAAETVGYEAATVGAWDDDTPRDTINARETRAAERGRGHHPQAPSAAKVSMRDAHGDPYLLRSLQTVGCATDHRADGGDYSTVLDTLLTNPTWATYRKYQWRTGPLGAAYLTDEGVYPVILPEGDTGDDTRPTGHVAPTSHADARIAWDVARMGAMGADVDAMAQ